MKTYLYNGPQPTTVTIEGKPYKLAPGKATSLPESKYVMTLLDRGLLSTPMPEDNPRRATLPALAASPAAELPRGKGGKGEAASNDSKGDS